MAGTSNYPGALDNFSAASPTNLGDDDATGRNHGERHDDLEAAVEAIQGELGVNPAGTATTVVARLDNLLSSTAALALGTAAAGTATSSARADHVHSSTISNPTFSGVASFPDGSASAPSVTNDGDTNTGVFFPAADTVAVATGGTERLRVSSAGNIGIGTTNPVAPLHLSSNTQSIEHIDTYSANTTASRILFRKARGTLASPDIVASGDNVADILMHAWDGNSFESVSLIRSSVDGTPGDGDMPGRLTFFTVADGTVTLTERMRIDSNGLITGTGTSLGAWTAYTPTLGGTGWAIGNGTATGYYCQIGKIVHFRAIITFGSTTTAGSGVLTVTTPVTARGAGFIDNALGRAAFYDASAATTYVGDFRGSGTSAVLPEYRQSLLGQEAGLRTTVPFTWDSIDSIALTGTYEAA